MLQKILIILAALLVLFVIVVALRSPDFTIVRTITIAAPPATVFAEVNDFPPLGGLVALAAPRSGDENHFFGSPAGLGSIYDWSGNDKAGVGRMTITNLQPNEQIRIQLEFIKPFAATNQSIFTFTPEGRQTRVRWEMIGHNNFIFKAVSIFVSMDKMIGGDFERGLASLKAVAEKSAPHSILP